MFLIQLVITSAITMVKKILVSDNRRKVPKIMECFAFIQLRFCFWVSGGLYFEMCIFACSSVLSGCLF